MTVPAAQTPSVRSPGPRFFCLGVLVNFTLASAQATRPSTAPAVDRFALLRELNVETQSLYQSVKLGLVEVELPHRPAPLADADNPVQKWNGRLDAAVREQLRLLQTRAAAGQDEPVEAIVATTQSATTQPATAQLPTTHPATSALNPTQYSTTQSAPAQVTPGNFSPAIDRAGQIIFTDRQQQRDLVISRIDEGLGALIGGGESFKAVGIVLDAGGHVLVPVYLKKESVEAQPFAAVDAAGNAVRCRFVGSDLQAGLTVLQMESPHGTPLKLSGRRPNDGSLVMLISPDGESGRLSIWTGGLQERGMVIGVDGSVQGFVRFGQFLSADAVRPLAEQLVRYGAVRRAVLGVLITQTQMRDGRPALLIEQVADHSAASAAGLQAGDYIRTFAGAAMTDLPSFSAAVAETDGRADLEVLRRDQHLTITVELRPQ